jgi:hypothetical protein
VSDVVVGASSSDSTDACKSSIGARKMESKGNHLPRTRKFQQQVTNMARKLSLPSGGGVLWNPVPKWLLYLT